MAIEPDKPDVSVNCTCSAKTEFRADDYNENRGGFVCYWCDRVTPGPRIPRVPADGVTVEQCREIVERCGLDARLYRNERLWTSRGYYGDTPWKASFTGLVCSGYSVRGEIDGIFQSVTGRTLYDDGTPGPVVHFSALAEATGRHCKRCGDVPTAFETLVDGALCFACSVDDVAQDMAATSHAALIRDAYGPPEPADRRTDGDREAQAARILDGFKRLVRSYAGRVTSALGDPGESFARLRRALAEVSEEPDE